MTAKTDLPKPGAGDLRWRFDCRDGEAVIEVRLAGRADLDAIDEIEIDSFIADRFERRNLRRMLNAGKTLFLLARIGGEAAGYLALAFRRGSGISRIYSIAVAPQHRGSGVARAMLDAALDLTGRRGCRQVHLEVRKSNTKAINLYQRAGFRLRGTREAYYEDREAALLFEADAPHSPGER
ncbi:ribosomal protein S18-alanine N-acetyltransferase [uncultured Maricaulis sp.]|uniref:ribosomal protein S18-alanine N-acetyltransferase n=1 Tax=uncultured Maricaulis sp. TaxID=174710 RepID=UPI0030D6D4DC|tara:strand:+ start:94445 stop:94987 length:543 start_codon:yes stop_codon:yes gene_type:complete